MAKAGQPVGFRSFTLRPRRGRSPYARVIDGQAVSTLIALVEQCGGRRLILSLCALGVLVTCASMYSVVHEVSPLSRDTAVDGRELATGAPMALGLQPNDAALPECELNAFEPEDSEQDASLHGTAVTFAGRAAPVASFDSKVVHVRCTAWPPQHLVSPALARGPPQGPRRPRA